MDDTRRVKILKSCPTHGLHVQDEVGKMGQVQPLKNGEPLIAGAEIVEITQDADDPSYLTLRTLCRSGPPKIANKKYRTGWDGVFGKRANPGGLN